MEIIDKAQNKGIVIESARKIKADIFLIDEITEARQEIKALQKSVALLQSYVFKILESGGYQK